MKLPKSVWIVAAVLFAAASVAIHYQVKVRLHTADGLGAVRAMGHLKVGEAAPKFSLADLANQPVTLSFFRGEKVVVLDFWATWCGPCRMAMPGLQTLHEELKDRGVLLVSVNQSEPAERVRGFIERKKYTFRTVLDRDGEVGNRYGIRAIPVVVVVDKKGLVRGLQVGYTFEDKELRQLLQQLVLEP
jgi:thiol-disulfide isomerase/thioredoxin